jgi:arsenate reductase
MKIYHNLRCAKSRTALQELEKKVKSVQVIEYLKDVPSVQELKSLCVLLNMKPFDLVRVTENLYKESYKGKSLSDAQWLDILHANPVLIQRPIVISKQAAVIAREEGVLTAFLKQHTS